MSLRGGRNGVEGLLQGLALRASAATGAPRDRRSLRRVRMALGASWAASPWLATARRASLCPASPLVPLSTPPALPLLGLHCKLVLLRVPHQDTVTSPHGCSLSAVCAPWRQGAHRHRRRPHPPPPRSAVSSLSPPPSPSEQQDIRRRSPTAGRGRWAGRARRRCGARPWRGWRGRRRRRCSPAESTRSASPKMRQ